MALAKSADAFRTISEAAEEVDVPQHVLRHWEEVFGHIRPMRRAGGRRYYRPVDLDLIRGVRVLLYDEKYTTKGVQKIFKENGVKFISELGRRAALGKSTELRRNGASNAQDNEEGNLPSVSGSTDQHALSSSLSGNLRAGLKSILSRLEDAEANLKSTTDALAKLDA
ncbi:MAG: MerR family transcriptional regulator [Pseudomonadota bacterium]